MRSNLKSLFLLPASFITLWSPGGSAQEAGKPDPSPPEIIKAFAAKESEAYEAWKQYAYRQIYDVRVHSVNGAPARDRLVVVSEIIFRDDGTREVKVVQRRGRLVSVIWTPEDTERINNLQPFALTEQEIPKYDLKYEGKERVDELNCYVFSVKPKSTRGGIYFQGKIWVDDQDLQIVRTLGKPVPQKSNNKFPEFETLRQVIDDKYWFPVWTHSDDKLQLGSLVHIEETITYENYKRFGSKATIDFGPAKPDK